MKPLDSSLELLESRIAPSAVFTFIDADGDSVKVTSSKGTNGQLAAAFTLSAGATGNPTSIDLTAMVLGVHIFSNADISIVSTASALGDGFVNVGQIGASGVDLGKVSLDGDLGRFVGGDPTQLASAVKALTVKSLGELDTSTGASNLNSVFDGRVDALTVKGNVRNALVTVLDSSGAAHARIGALTITGSLIADPFVGANSGSIITTDGFGAVKIGGDIRGTTANTGGLRATAGGIASLTVGGSVLGGGGAPSGFVTAANDLGPVKIANDLIGGGGNESGKIIAHNITSLTVGGSIIGGAGNYDTVPTVLGQVHAAGSLGALKIGGNLQGGAGNYSGTIFGTGGVGAVTIAGSLYTGSGPAAGGIANDGTVAGPIKIGHEIRGAGQALIYLPPVPSLTVGGSVFGDPTVDLLRIFFEHGIGTITIKGSLSFAQIEAVTVAPGVGVPTMALKAIMIGGNVDRAFIAAGLNGSTGFNSEVQIGSVTVRGDWIASNLTCGCEAGSDMKFGTSDDNLSGSSTPPTGTIAKIGSIVIKGQVQGTPGGADNYGFVAEQIGKISVAGHSLPLVPGAATLADFHFVGATGDVRYLEVIS